MEQEFTEFSEFRESDKFTNDDRNYLQVVYQKQLKRS